MTPAYLIKGCSHLTVSEDLPAPSQEIDMALPKQAKLCRSTNPHQAKTAIITSNEVPTVKTEDNKMPQNTSHAVMAQRAEPADSLDDFPTPPWATRALVEHVLRNEHDLSSMSVWEPACNRGYMVQALKPYFREVIASDVSDYGFGRVADFLDPSVVQDVDWVITNPPFRLAEQFILKALIHARVGVAMLVRTSFLESIGRHKRLFSVRPPSRVAQFAERVPMVKGRLDPSVSTATSYCWTIWMRGVSGGTEITWIPPCRKDLEQSADYVDLSTARTDILRGLNEERRKRTAGPSGTSSPEIASDGPTRGG